MQSRKQVIVAALDGFIRQRSGLDPCNYGDTSSYRSEQRSITRDRHHAENLLRAVVWRDSITADDLIAASKDAYCGRMTITETDSGVSINYCTGQYFPTEYRRAVCAVLAGALWSYTRENAMPQPKLDERGDKLYDGECAGSWLRNKFQREFGRSIANRWFN